MTREEAIEQLQNCKGLILQDGKDWLDERDIPLIDMAISALQAEPSEYVCWLESIIVTDEPCWLCEDSIDDEWCDENCGKSSIQAECLRHFFKVLSAETHEIRTETHECVKETHDSDLISRSEALREMAQAECGVNYEHCCEDDCTCSYIQRILDIPSVSAERVGVWIPSNIPNEKWVCSECGGACWYYDYQGSLGKSNYCPNCGARMRGAE